MGLGDTAVATIAAAVIAAIVGYVTNRTSAKANKQAATLAAEAAVHNQSVASRTEIEHEAFVRAKGYYTDTIDRQDREIHELESEVASLKARIRALEQDAATTTNELNDLRQQLRLAHEALRLKYPDES